MSAKPATVTEAFDHAATRHWNDAVLLAEQNRRPNADQLFGFAAECAIKTALRQLTGFAPGGELAPRYRTHINELWDRILVQGASEKRFPTLVALLKLPNPFQDWSVDHRYASDDAVSEEAFKQHRDMTKRILGIMGLIGSRRRS